MLDRRYRMGAHSTYFKGGECRKQLRTDLFPLLCFFHHLSISASTHFSWWALLIDNELRITILFFASTTFILKWNNTKSWKWWSKSLVSLSLGITMTFQYFCGVFGSFADFLSYFVFPYRAAPRLEKPWAFRRLQFCRDFWFWSRTSHPMPRLILSVQTGSSQC